MTKKAKLKRDDDLRAEYKRSDFGVMERGKFLHLARLALEGKDDSGTDAVKSLESLLETRKARFQRTS